jgi:hypothetical protein
MKRSSSRGRRYREAREREEYNGRKEKKKEGKEI